MLLYQLDLSGRDVFALKILINKEWIELSYMSECYLIGDFINVMNEGYDKSNIRESCKRTAINSRCHTPGRWS